MMSESTQKNVWPQNKSQKTECVGEIQIRLGSNTATNSFFFNINSKKEDKIFPNSPSASITLA